jgi:hypothetical protein
MLLNPPSRLLGRVNAIMSTTSVPYVVDDFPGPLSIKWMAAGWGIWETDSGYYRVDPACDLVSITATSTRCRSKPMSRARHSARDRDDCRAPMNGPHAGVSLSA